MTKFSQHAYAAECDSVDLLPNFEQNFENVLPSDRESVPPPDVDVLNDANIGEFIEQNKNINTAKKTKTNLNVWKRWCSYIGEAREIENIPPSELDRLLCLFFINIKKQDGTQLDPSTLTSFHRSFARHLRYRVKPYCLFNDNKFAKSRATLESKKKKQLRKKEKGRCPNKAHGLGDHCPEALIRTVWLNNTTHFGWRARDEHRRV